MIAVRLVNGSKRIEPVNTRTFGCPHMICGVSLMIFTNAIINAHRQMEYLSADTVGLAEKNCAAFNVLVRRREEIVFSRELCRGADYIHEALLHDESYQFGDLKKPARGKRDNGQTSIPQGYWQAEL